MFFQNPVFSSVLGFFEKPFVLRNFDQRAFERFLDHLAQVISRVDPEKKFSLLSSFLQEAYNSYQNLPRAVKLLTHVRALSLGTWVPYCLWAPSFERFQDEFLLAFLEQAPPKDLDVLKKRCHLVSVLLGGKNFSSSEAQVQWRLQLDDLLNREDFQQLKERSNLKEEDWQTFFSQLERCLIIAFGAQDFDFLMMKILISILTGDQSFVSSWLKLAFEQGENLHDFLDVVRDKAIEYQVSLTDGFFYYHVLCGEIRTSFSEK